MVVRIRMGRGPVVRNRPPVGRLLAAAFGALLKPAALMACVLAVWRIAADLRWTSTFAISRGPFSHWQVWMAVGVSLLVTGAWLDRYGDPVEPILDDEQR